MSTSPFVKDVDTAGFVAEVVERSRQVPVVVDFWAEWCGPCKTLGPLLERVADEYGGAFELAKIDVDANQQLSAQMRIQSIPTVVAFANGQPVAQFSGAIPEAQLREWLSQFVEAPGDDRMVEIEQLIEIGADQAAATKLAAIIQDEPGNKDAVLMLASLYIDNSDTDAALGLLDTLPPSTEVDQLRAAASLSAVAGDIEGIRSRLATDPDNDELRIELARAMFATGAFEAGFAPLLEIVQDRGDHADAARAAMVEAFNLLGNEHPLVGTWRRRLASALF